MAREKEGQSLREYKNRKKRYRRRRLFLTVSVLMTIFIAGTWYLYRLYNRNYRDYEVINSVPNTGEITNQYLEYNGNIVRFSRDGAVAVGKEGELLWNGAYQMMDPIADISDKYVAVADRGNKSIHIYNEKGEAGSFKSIYDILKVQVASQGVVAVLMEDDKNNYIHLYDKEGTLLVDGKITEVSEEGFPMDITLSEDGKKMAVSFLSVNQGILLNTLSFYNFGEVGQSYIEGGVGGYKFEDVIIPKVTFLDNNTVCAFKENGFILISMKEVPEDMREETFDGTIKSVMHSKKYVGLVLEDPGSMKSRLLLHNIKGEKLVDIALDFHYDKVVLSGEEIIFYNKLSCRVYKVNGRLKFEYNFNSDIEAFMPINHMDRYYLINSEELKTIQLIE